MRLTMGQIVSPAVHPAANSRRPARARAASFSLGLRRERSSSPAIRPKIIVAIEGTKFKVW